MFDDSRLSVIGYSDHKPLKGVAGYDICGIKVKINNIRPFPHKGYTTDYICDCEEF